MQIRVREIEGEIVSEAEAEGVSWWVGGAEAERVWLAYFMNLWQKQDLTWELSES